MIDSPLAHAPAARATDGRFVDPDDHADVAVVVVTYNSARDLARLLESLRREAGAQRLRVVVADNASADGTPATARAHDDVVTVETGGNLGYAAGINAALRHVGDADAILVLNPDLVVEEGCIAALRQRLASSGAGVVVPRYLEDGAVFTSLRREPSVLRALGDSAFGEHFARRPGALSEWVLDRREYAAAHEVEWATGAALLIDAAVARTVGDWDERFFLYSEETDFFRRVREAGASVWYEPAAVVRHERGGSGHSVELDKLVTVNRVRYFRKHHGRVASASFRAVTVLHQLARVASPVYRPLLFSVADESSWPTLPRAQRIPDAQRVSQARGTLVVDARRLPEDAASAEAVATTVRALAPFAANPRVQVVVARADGLHAVAPGGVAGEAAVPLGPGAGGLAAPPTLVVEAGLAPDAAAVVDTLDASEATGAPAAPPHEWCLDDARPLVRLFTRLAPASLRGGPRRRGCTACRRRPTAR
ncbi:glycosyltransferase [Xylanimonas allomyrinae]|uniref:Glycosyltransferase n=1 Tax=Xylanimonas allomyrinae TaxID=2509459 RepID=A0A4P6ENS0_9MICO|nr:glycosyltransferase family 2 protein [Xylanimonas allomyrinae]QAY61967.1 glycosyltransferase [Xylanimonas allomyrinae]